MDGLGLWLGEGRNLHGDYKAIRAWRAGLYCFYVGHGSQ